MADNGEFGAVPNAVPNALPPGGGSVGGAGIGTSTAPNVRELPGYAAQLASSVEWLRRNNDRAAGILQRLRGCDIERSEDRQAPESQGTLPGISASLTALDGALQELQAMLEQLEEIV